jgi:hypothetical protein
MAKAKTTREELNGSGRRRNRPSPEAGLTSPHHQAGARAAEDDAQLAALRTAGEAHLWPGPYKPEDLASDNGLKFVVDGAGPWVLDADGKTWFDSLSGMWLTNVGHGRREVADAVFAQMGRLSYAPDGTVSPTTVLLAARIASVSPDPHSRVFFVSGGSEAVETAIKMAKKYHRNLGEPGRYKVISRRGSYHGCTLGCLGLGGGGSNTGVEYGPLLPGMVRVQGPDEYRRPFSGDGVESDLECAREIERAIVNEGPETVAAVIGEPISAAAGVHVPHDGSSSGWPPASARRFGCSKKAIPSFSKAATSWWVFLRPTTGPTRPPSRLALRFWPGGTSAITRRVSRRWIFQESCCVHPRSV